MVQNSRLQLMLIAAVLLSAIKFGLLPVLEWQDDVLQQIAAVEKRNFKSQKLLEDKDQLEMKMVQIGAGYNKLAQSLPVYPDQSSYRLETQLMIEQVLKIDDFHTKQFFWRTDLDKNHFGNLYSSSFNIDFIGSAKKFVLLQTKIAANYPEFRVLNMSNRLSGYSETSLGKIDATLTIEAYYWRGGLN